MHVRMRRGTAMIAIASLVVAGAAGVTQTQQQAPAARAAAGSNVDWPITGGNSDNTHYSSLAQITKANVSKLGVAWTASEGNNLSEFETVPVVVNGVMYYTTNSDQVRAVNAATGAAQVAVHAEGRLLQVGCRWWRGTSDQPRRHGREWDSLSDYLRRTPDRLAGLHGRSALDEQYCKSGR